jgi:hypothetical protein
MKISIQNASLIVKVVMLKLFAMGVNKSVGKDGMNI